MGKNVQTSNGDVLLSCWTCQWSDACKGNDGNFVQAIRSSKKSSLRDLLKVVEYDTRSVTGSNLRTILLKSSAQNIQQLSAHHVTAKYRDISGGEEFRVGFINEIIEVVNNNLEVTGFADEELQDILQHLCVSWCLLGDAFFLLFLDSFPGVLLFCQSPNMELSNIVLESLVKCAFDNKS